MKTGWVVESKYTTKKELRKLCKEEKVDPEDFSIKSFSDVEISVVRKNNKLGIKSYGWGGLDKIILFEDRDYTKKDIGWCKEVAEIICEALNKNGSCC